MNIGPWCPDCGWIHGASSAHAVGLFRPDGPLGYRANIPGAPLRPTRKAAERDYCEHRQRQNWETQP